MDVSRFQVPTGGWLGVIVSHQLCVQGTSFCLTLTPRFLPALGYIILLYDKDRKLSYFSKSKENLSLGLQVWFRALQQRWAGLLGSWE